jgi:hypothetical protein
LARALKRDELVVEPLQALEGRELGCVEYDAAPGKLRLEMTEERAVNDGGL